MRTYWAFFNKMAVIDGIRLKGRCVVIPEALQQLHVNHMGIKETSLVACKSIYWPGMNNDIKNHIQMFLQVLISANAVKGNNNSPWNSRKTMGSSCSRHVYHMQ